MMHEYKMRKTSWGIFIVLDAEEIANPVVNRVDIKVAERIYLRIDSATILSKEFFMPWMELGIKALANEIYKKIEDKVAVCIYVKNIHFHVAHFQEEGFYCAIQEWLARCYGFEVAPVNIVYNRNRNRYVFDIPAL